MGSWINKYTTCYQQWQICIFNEICKKGSILTEIQTPDLCHKRLFSPDEKKEPNSAEPVQAHNEKVLLLEAGEGRTITETIDELWRPPIHKSKEGNFFNCCLVG